MPKIGRRKALGLLGAALISAGGGVLYHFSGLGGVVGLLVVLQTVTLLLVGWSYVRISGSERKHSAATSRRLDRLRRSIDRETSRNARRLTKRHEQFERSVESLVHDRIDPSLRELTTQQVKTRRSIDCQLRVQYRQVEALLALYRDVDPPRSLPALRGWSASPDLLLYLYHLVLKERPRRILECGSGASTVVLAYALKAVGQGQLTSLDHLEHYCAATRAQLCDHGMDSWANVEHAPLAPAEIEGQPWLWYNLDAVPEGPIDLVVIDGPPAQTQPNARFPAMPLLRGRLSESAVLVLDDLVREDEQEIVRRWLDQFDDWVLEEVDHEKVTGVLRRRSTTLGRPSGGTRASESGAARASTGNAYP